ncbi:MAG: hypothetical protein OXE78_10200, partial [Gammaproteobacteria bacterium]|nr:hypothetical protein [Gammaproteobacteria bacterium]
RLLFPPPPRPPMIRTPTRTPPPPPRPHRRPGGGDVNLHRLSMDVQDRLLGDQDAFCKTFIDFYGLPQNFLANCKQEHNTMLVTSKLMSLRSYYLM